MHGVQTGYFVKRALLMFIDKVTSPCRSKMCVLRHAPQRNPFYFNINLALLYGKYLSLNICT